MHWLFMCSYSMESLEVLELHTIICTSTEVLMCQFASKQQIVNTHNQSLTALYDSLLTSLPLQCSVLLSSEKGSSSWLTTYFTIT